MTTSGITSGAFTMPENRVRPLKRRYFVSAKAASVPRITAPVALHTAICRLSHRPLRISLSSASLPYHLKVKPVQRFGICESLNE